MSVIAVVTMNIAGVKIRKIAATHMSSAALLIPLLCVYVPATFLCPKLLLSFYFLSSSSFSAMIDYCGSAPGRWCVFVAHGICLPPRPPPTSKALGGKGGGPRVALYIKGGVFLL